MKLKTIDPILYALPEAIKVTSTNFLLTLSTGYLIAGSIDFGIKTKLNLTVNRDKEPIELTAFQREQLETVVFHKLEIIGKL